MGAIDAGQIVEHIELEEVQRYKCETVVEPRVQADYGKYSHNGRKGKAEKMLEMVGPPELVKVEEK